QYVRFAKPEWEAGVTQWLSDYAVRLEQEHILYGQTFEARKIAMKRVNPKYIFRNYMAQEATDALEKGDDSILNNIMRLIEHPYDEQPEFERYFALRPEWADDKPGCSSLSCSS